MPIGTHTHLVIRFVIAHRIRHVRKLPLQQVAARGCSQHRSLIVGVERVGHSERLAGAFEGGETAGPVM